MSANVADVVIIGGGPAGSTAGILLAEKGYKVALLEKSRHPRFHIGESLLPANLPLFERLGIAPQISAISLEKPGAEFVSPSHGRGETFLFEGAWNKDMPFGYQVRRSEFDEILIRRAAACGVTVLENCKVNRVDFAGSVSKVQASLADEVPITWDAKFIIDASGRDTLLAKQLEAKSRNKKHNSAAMYAHFSGAERYPGSRAGLISIYWFEHGWFWFIPLADGATSVGAVVWPYYMKNRNMPLNDYFMQAIAHCQPLAKRLSAAQLVTDVEATGNYSYAANHSHGDNYLLLGDAYAFIDPVFSSGVWLAMNSAVAGADAVDVCLRTPESSIAALKRFDRIMQHGPRELSWFIYRITTPTMRELFMNPRNLFRTQEALMSVLAGDIFGKTPIWTALNIFKALYGTASLLGIHRSLKAMLHRRRNIREA